MNTAFILAIIVLGALSAALGAMLAAARREAGHLRADKTAAEQARLQAEADIRVQIETRLRTETELAALRASSQTEIAGLKQKNAEERAAERAPSTMIARMNAVFILTKVEFSVEFFVSLTDKLFDSCNV